MQKKLAPCLGFLVIFFFFISSLAKADDQSQQDTQSQQETQSQKDTQIATQVFGWSGTVAASFLSLPDGIKAFRNPAEYAKAYTFFGAQGLLLINASLWLTYGVLSQLYQVEIANAICLGIGSVAAIRVLIERHRPVQQPQTVEMSI
jgi:hypothetical protein